MERHTHPRPCHRVPGPPPHGQKRPSAERTPCTRQKSKSPRKSRLSGRRGSPPHRARVLREPARTSNLTSTVWSQAGRRPLWGAALSCSKGFSPPFNSVQPHRDCPRVSGWGWGSGSGAVIQTARLRLLSAPRCCRLGAGAETHGFRKTRLGAITAFSLRSLWVSLKLLLCVGFPLGYNPQSQLQGDLNITREAISFHSRWKFR